MGLWRTIQLSGGALCGWLISNLNLGCNHGRSRNGTKWDKHWRKHLETNLQQQ